MAANLPNVDAPRSAARAAGFGEATTAHPAAKGTANALAPSGGFGPASTAASPPPQKKAASPAGFGEVTAEKPTHRQTTAPETRITAAVRILSKPRPAYTDEARQRQIEGEVTLRVLFTAAGEVKVLGVVRSLGHGLDENASRAASGIRFQPAESAGRPVDSTALVHISFQLAY